MQIGHGVGRLGNGNGHGKKAIKIKATREKKGLTGTKKHIVTQRIMGHHQQKVARGHPLNHPTLQMGRHSPHHRDPTTITTKARSVTQGDPVAHSIPFPSPNHLLHIKIIPQKIPQKLTGMTYRTASDNVGVIGEHVDQLSFPLIAPLGAEDDTHARRK